MWCDLICYACWSLPIWRPRWSSELPQDHRGKVFSNRNLKNYEGSETCFSPWSWMLVFSEDPHCGLFDSWTYFYFTWMQGFAFPNFRQKSFRGTQDWFPNIYILQNLCFVEGQLSFMACMGISIGVEWLFQTTRPTLFDTKRFCWKPLLLLPLLGKVWLCHTAKNKRELFSLLSWSSFGRG